MQRPPIALVFLVALPVTLIAFLFVSNSRAATETPDYKVVRADGKFEIRDYPALTVATTPLGGADMNGSFMKLFRFISGGNDGAQKIAMTAPVLIDTTKNPRTMSFIMPKTAVEQGVPKPVGDGVVLGEIGAARMAVWRFGGGRTTANEQAAITQLMAWLAEQKLVAKGEPFFAYYDPPWTPLFMRRNEVLIRIDKSQG